MFNEENILKVYFDCETTSLLDDAKLISIGLITDCNNIFYAELNDYDYRLDTDPYNSFDKNDIAVDKWTYDNIIQKLIFKEFFADDTKCFDNTIQIYKAGSENIALFLKEWLKHINTNNKIVCFYGDNICHTGKFLFRLLPKLSCLDMINMPIDLFTSFALNDVYYWRDRYQYVWCHSLDSAKSYLDDVKIIHRMLNNNTELDANKSIIDFKHNALYDALTIKHCFKCLLK